MRIAVVTLFPEMFAAVSRYGVTGRAAENGLLELFFSNPRDFAADRHGTVDDRPYGGGPGMLMKMDTLTAALAAARKALDAAPKDGDGGQRNGGEAAAKTASAPMPSGGEHRGRQSGNEGSRMTQAAPEPAAAPRVIYLSPQGRPFNHAKALELSRAGSLILVAGRYAGVDERFIEAAVDEELSIGDAVLSGGELPAMVVIDAVCRQLPGALGCEQSAERDSFAAGLLDCPHYTRPEVYDGRRVPEALLSGDHERVRRWRLRQALGRTWERRRDLLDALRKERALTPEEEELLAEYLDERQRG